MLFNARFYYPVFAVLFVDLGLTLEQFSFLNVAWATSIVLFELPLGAVADRFGRKKLVLGAALLMVVEMSVLAFIPTGNGTLLFVVFLVNRVLSGLAEAAASGADEALAYDTLVAEGRADDWPRVLSHLQRLMAVGFVVSMLIGAVVYDPDLVNGALGTSFAQIDTARFPVYLTLGLALGAVAVAARMREVPVAEDGDPDLSGVLAAGKWIRATPFVLALIAFTLVIDSAVRMFYTLNSSYFRMIGIPAAYFGVIGAVFAGLGLVTPFVANPMLRRFQPWTNFGIMALLVCGGLIGVAASPDWYGVAFALLLVMGMQLLGFLGSQYLHESTSSSMRATVLSFKSLAGNMAYGLAGVLYAVGYRALAGGEIPEPGSAHESEVLSSSLAWFPVVFAVAIAPLLLWSRRIDRMRRRVPHPAPATGD